jgi:aspartate/methionine/tyrosine aminotransferase
MNIQPSKLERYFAKYEFKAPFLLCTSDCQSFSVQDLFSLEPEAEEEFKDFWLGYTETQGNPELRETIATLYTNSKAGDIIVCAGAEEGIFVFMNTLLEPGDHIIVQSPTYQSLYEIANALKCSVTEWHMDANNHWELDLNELKDSITARTKAIVINFPANPTGYLPSNETYRRIIDIAREHDLYLFSDEVYRFLEYDPADRLPAACDVYDKAVSLGVMSKAFGLAGLRIGWVVIKNRELFDGFSRFKDFTTICSSGPGEFFANLALKHKQAILDRNLDIIDTNLAVLEPFFKKHSRLFEWERPKAGPLSFPRFSHQNSPTPYGGAESFCLELLEKTGVLLLPGTMFNGKQPGRHLRFGFGRLNMPRALEKLDLYLESR